jgi:hypothetical protein
MGEHGHGCVRGSLYGWRFFAAAKRQIHLGQGNTRGDNGMSSGRVNSKIIPGQRLFIITDRGVKSEVLAHKAGNKWVSICDPMYRFVLSSKLHLQEGRVVERWGGRIGYWFASEEALVDHENKEVARKSSEQDWRSLFDKVSRAGIYGMPKNCTSERIQAAEKLLFGD